jgi:hypothetical protein
MAGAFTVSRGARTRASCAGWIFNRGCRTLFARAPARSALDVSWLIAGGCLGGLRGVSVERFRGNALTTRASCIIDPNPIGAVVRVLAPRKPVSTFPRKRGQRAQAPRHAREREATTRTTRAPLLRDLDLVALEEQEVPAGPVATRSRSGYPRGAGGTRGPRRSRRRASSPSACCVSCRWRSRA